MKDLGKTYVRIGSVSFAALALALAATPAAAQQSPTSAVEAPAATPAAAGTTATGGTSSDRGVFDEIVVTANRRSEPLQKVGIAVTAYSGDQLRALGVSNSVDVAKFTPGVAATGAQGGFLQTISIRGVTQTDFNPHQEAPVAAYQDDVYISSIQGQTFATFDSERVEILKGPQGTLFGRNATGGLVNYISRKPTETLNGFIDARYGRFDLRQVEAAVGGPISGDKVMVRVAGFYSAHGAILKNLIGPNSWTGETYAGRAHLLLKPTDNFEALFTGRYGKVTSSVSAAFQFPSQIAILDAAGNQIDGRFLGANETAQVITPAGPVGTRACAGCTFFGYRDPDGPGRLTADPLVGKATSYTMNKGATPENWSISYGGSGRLTYTAGDISLVNLADYTHFRWRTTSANLGGSALPFGYDTFAKGIDQYSDEFRVIGNHGPFRWTLGTYYLNIKNRSGSGYGFLPGGIDAVGTPGDEVFTFNQRTRSISGFGQIEYDIAPELTAIGGVRFLRDRKSFAYRADLVAATGVTTATLFRFDPSVTPVAKRTDKLWAWKAGLNWKPDAGVLIYATVNRGVKGGGYNAPSQPLAFNLYSFKPEKLTAYEAGFKTSLTSQITFNGGGFYYDYKDYQALQTFGLGNYIVNAPSRTYGAEVELRARPVRHLDLMLGGAYTNAIVRDVAVAPTYVVDRRAAFSPRWQGNALARYEIPSSIGMFALQANVSYRSSYYLQLANFQDERNAAFALVDLRASLAGNDKAGWEVYAAVQNLTDHSYQVASFDIASSFGQGTVAYNMPRTWEVGVRFAF
jgi:iron complex outermembrane receptor protein